MSMKDDIIKIITEKGPKTDKELATLLGQKQPSVRRARNELYKAEKLSQTLVDGEYRWSLDHAAEKSSEEETKPETKAAVTAIGKKKPKTLKLAEDPPTPVEKKDWRNTDFTF